jgi:hypothetical protein
MVVQVRVLDGKKEFFLDPDEEDLFRKADQEIKEFNAEKKQLIEDIFSNNILKTNFSDCNESTKVQIAKSLEILMSQEATVFILNTIHNVDHVKEIVAFLELENIVHKETANYLKVLSSKYGSFLENLMKIADNPYEWTRIQSYGKISDTTLLSSLLWRRDGKYFEFDVSLQAGITLANHFTRRIYDTIEAVDKELILELDMNEVDQLEQKIMKLKELYDSMESILESPSEKAEEIDD